MTFSFDTAAAQGAVIKVIYAYSLHSLHFIRRATY